MFTHNLSSIASVLFTYAKIRQQWKSTLSFSCTATMNNGWRTRKSFSLLYAFSLGAKYSYIGRYRAPSKTILGRPVITLKSLKNAKKNCQRLARMRRAWAFALRFGRQCFLAQTNPRKFTKYGLPRTKMPGALKVFIVRGKNSLNSG